MTTYPAAIDDLTRIGATLDNPPHTSIHNAEADAIEAIQATLGVNPQGAYVDVATRLSNSASAPGSVTPALLHQEKIWDPLHAAWAQYSPSFAGVNTGATSEGGAWYKRIGTLCWVQMDFVFGVSGAVADEVSFTLPFTPKRGLISGSATFIIFGGKPLATGVHCNGSVVKILWEPNTSGYWDENGPSTGTAGDQLTANIFYETSAVPTDSLV